MKILYIGCVESSYLLLEKLIEAGADIVGVITKKESNYNSDFRDLVPLCEKKEIPYELVENINEEKVYKFIENIQPEIAFCFGWSQLIKDNIITGNSLYIFHDGCLSRYWRYCITKNS